MFGKGIEKGVPHTPLDILNEAKTLYVDRYDIDNLKLHYPELRKVELVNFIIIDDG